MPLPSVVTTRGASSAGLVASTVTPGNTAFEVSRTVPVIVACANTADGRRQMTAADTATRNAKVKMQNANAHLSRAESCLHFEFCILNYALLLEAHRQVEARKPRLHDSCRLLPLPTGHG